MAASFTERSSPLTHNLEAQFDATPDTFHLSPIRISSGASHIVLSATADHYSTSPAIQATYEVVADGAQLARLLIMLPFPPDWSAPPDRLNTNLPQINRCFRD